MARSKGPTLAGRLRRRSLHGLRNLDKSGWLLDNTSPTALGLVVFISVAFVALAMFFAGQVGAPRVPLFMAVVTAAVVAIAAGAALTTSRYHAEKQLEHAQTELISLHGELELEQTSRRALLHDARAVVGAMGAALHALQRSGQQQEVRSAMASQVDHLRQLLATPTTTLRATALDRFQEPLLSFANLHGLSVAVDLPARVQVLADPIGVSTILLNLLDNARKYAPRSPIRVIWEPAGQHVLICVEDKGPGMPASAEILFAEGAQANDEAEGSGLGLATARRLAEKNQGALWHEERSGPGARFVLKLIRASETSQDGGTL